MLTTSLRLPDDLSAALERFQARFSAAHQAAISQHEAILTLLRRGLAASAEMVDPVPERDLVEETMGRR